MARMLSPSRPTEPPHSKMSDPDEEIAVDGKAETVTPPEKPVYYIDDIGDRLKADMRRQFETYSRIPADEVEAHLYAARSKAWQINPYPCLGMWSFLNPVLRHLKFYPSLLSRAQEPDILILDVGCGMGQDLRQLIFDGVSPEKLCAADVDHGLWKVGMELWEDRDRLAVMPFLKGSLLDLEAVGGDKDDGRGMDGVSKKRTLKEVKGRFDVVHAGHVLHLFQGKDVLKAAVNMVLLTRPGGWISLHQIGGQGMWPTQDEFPGHMHNGTSWRELWREVERSTGIQFDVETWSGDFAEWEVATEDIRWLPPGSRAFQMIARRRD